MAYVDINVTLPFKGDGGDVIAEMWRVFYEKVGQESAAIDRAVWICGDEPANVAIHAAGPSDDPQHTRFIIVNAVGGLDALFHSIDTEASDIR